MLRRGRGRETCWDPAQGTSEGAALAAAMPVVLGPLEASLQPPEAGLWGLESPSSSWPAAPASHLVPNGPTLCYPEP